MSSLITRIGWIRSNLKNVKERVIKNGKAVVGFGIVALTSISWAVLQNTHTDGPAVIHVKNNFNVFSKTIENSGDDKGSKVNPEEKKEEPNKSTEKDENGQQTVILLNLEQFVKQKALKLHKSESGSYFKRDDTVSVVDWSDVMLFPEPLRIKRNSGNLRYSRYNWDTLKSEISEDVADHFRVVSRLVLKNDSSDDQHHKLKFEKKFVSVFRSSLIQGYTNGPSVELRISMSQKDNETYLPDKIMLPNAKGTTEEDTSTLVVEDQIKVSRKSTSVVSMLVSKKERNYSFWTNITFRGEVSVKFYDKKEILIACYIIPIEEIISSLPKHYNIGVIEGRLKLTYKINKIHVLHNID